MSNIKKSFGLVFPAMRISIALAFLTSCILLTADMLGFTPDEDRIQLKARKQVSESLAIQFSGLDLKNDANKLERLVRVVATRNDDILSAGIRLSSGQVIYQSPNHGILWEDYNSAKSTSSHVLVPLLSQGKDWGNVEIRFKELHGETLSGFTQRSVFKLMIFFLVVGSFAYLGFMLRTLRQLDPAAVIPERVNAAFDTLSEGVMIVDEKGQILLTNATFGGKAGIDGALLLGKSAADLNWQQADPPDSDPDFPWLAALESGETVAGAQLSLISDTGETYKFVVNASPIHSPEGATQGVLVTLDDVTELEERNVELQTIVQNLEAAQAQVNEQNKELSYLATRDALTGCLNRRAFSEQFEVLFNAAKQDDSELSCIMIDLDHFKTVNDKFGHAMGDEVIKMLAEVLKSSSRKDDLVARYGGEEFCLVLRGMPQNGAVKVAERIRLRIKDESSSRFENGPRVTASLGVASIRDNPIDPGNLNHLADEALYAAKQTGRNRVVSRSSMDASGDMTEEVVVPNSSSTQSTESVASLHQRIDELEAIASEVSSELEYSKSYDALTGLPNEVLFYDRVHQAIERGYRQDRVAAVLIIDIEMFSQVNAKFGRAGGDELLKKLAYRLNSIVRKTDGVSRLSVSRFAGDEFAVLLTDLQQKEQVTWAVNRLLTVINEPIEVGDETLQLTSHIGISLYPSDADSVEALLNNAMIAKQYSKKHADHHNYQFYDHNVQDLSVKQLQLEKDLLRAIDNEEWMLNYQPKWDVGARKIVGVEALIRWNHPDRGIIPPFEFIEFAEQRGHIVKIGAWVIREACRQLREWLDMGIQDCKIAINLSSVQLTRPTIAQEILDTLDEYKVPPRMFEIEITETLLMENVQQVIESLERLHTRKISIAIDDFGTGYSSLNYLKALPIDSLKIDRGFIRDLCEDHNDRQIVQTLISMSHSMGMKVIAEGVEDHAQLELLKEYSVDEIQGYLLSKPIDPDAIVAMLRKPDPTRLDSNLVRMQS